MAGSDFADGWRLGAADKGHEGAKLGEEEVRALQGKDMKLVSRARCFRFASGSQDDDGRKDKTADMMFKVVRRKAGKRHVGHLYIICKANPRHKQRQG